MPVLLTVATSGVVPVDLEAAAAAGRAVGMVELQLHGLAGGEAGDRLADVHVAAADVGVGREQPDVVDRGAGVVDRAEAAEAQRVVAGDRGDEIGLGLHRRAGAR